MLAFGLASYAGSHASAFNEKYLEEKHSQFKTQVTAQSADTIILHQVRLACLHEFVGGQYGRPRPLEENPRRTTKK